MEEPAAGRECPQCGARNERPGDRCAACGAALPLPAPEWTQPVFERALEEAGLEDAGGKAGGGSASRGALRRVRPAIEGAAETALAVALQPEATFRSFRLDGGLRAPLLYSLLLAGPSALLNALWKAELPGSPFEGRFRFSLPLVLGLLVLTPPLYLYVRAQILHLTLVFTGYVRQPFTVTFRLVSYANASVAPLLVVPVAGDFLFLLLGAVVEATAIRFGHGIALKQAAIAEILPAAFLAVALVAAVVVALVGWSRLKG